MEAGVLLAPGSDVCWLFGKRNGVMATGRGRASCTGTLQHLNCFQFVSI